MTEQQKESLRAAFAWHATYRLKLADQCEHGVIEDGVRWQHAKLYRDEALADAGLPDLFKDE